MAIRMPLSGSACKSGVGLAALAVAFGLLLGAAAVADGGGGHGGGHSGGHSSHSGHSGHGGGGHSGGGHRGHVSVQHGVVHGHGGNVGRGHHGRDHVDVHPGGIVPHALHGDRTFAGLVDHHDFHDGHVWPGIHPHHFLHPHRFHGHGHAFVSFGYRSFYAPSYYRYRDYCDPYSFYYDPRYCYRYDPSYGPSAYYSAPLMGTDFPTLNKEEVRSQQIPDGVGARVPFISSPGPPDAVF